MHTGRSAILMLSLLGLSGCAGPASERQPAAVSDEAESDAIEDRPVVETGRWHRTVERESPVRIDQPPAGWDRVLTLPYLRGSHPAPARDGVTVLDEPRAQAGLNLYNSGHGPEAFAIDLHGRVLHRWSYPIERIWPEDRSVHQSSYWRRVHWLPNGDLLAIFEGIGLLRLDRNSNLKFAYKGQVHHHAVVREDGGILTLTRRARVVPRINPDQPVLEDFLTRLSPTGDLIEEFSLLTAFERSGYAHLLDQMKREGDIFHTNSIEVLDGRFSDRASWLRRGNLLLSSFFLDTIFVLDPQRREVVWALRGSDGLDFKGQHDPQLLANGRLLLLDNWGRSGKSRVLEFDPLTLQIAWRYPASPDSAFHTPTCGTSQRLPNGNTLITESDRGRAFEVTPEGEIVWEFLNPNRAGENQELIATLFEVKRVSDSYFPWLQ